MLPPPGVPTGGMESLPALFVQEAPGVRATVVIRESMNEDASKHNSQARKLKNITDQAY